MTEDTRTLASPGRDRIRPSPYDTGEVLDPRGSIAEPARWMIRTQKGGEVDEDALRASPARDVQAAPMLRRHDGSVTDW